VALGSEPVGAEPHTAQSLIPEFTNARRAVAITSSAPPCGRRHDMNPLQSEISVTPVAIVGAGPYGLSLAAHLDTRGVPFRIFGHPMEVWRSHMPQGMFLKSDGFASNLYDPDRQFTLRRHCERHGIPYRDEGLPVRLDSFIDYGLAFQKAVVPTLTDQLVLRVERATAGFRLEIAGGETVMARAVVLATGISHCAFVPQTLRELPPGLCTHSSAHHDLSRFAGRRVIVVGGGASATDIAALLHAARASVEILSRSPVEFHARSDPKARTLWKRIQAPNLGLGPNLRSALYTAFPALFHLLPQALRLRIVRKHLGPAGGWFIREHVEGKIPMLVGYTIRDAQAVGQGVRLRCQDGTRNDVEVLADHVIAATGYHPSVDRLDLLDAGLRAAIRREDDSPLLSRRFESNVPGLYFIGVSSANSFGPVMRFSRGAEWTAVHLARHLATSR
jgi:thioredoxin reductase